MGKKRLLQASAILIGSIIGAGILGLPYVFSKAGFLTGVLNLALIGAMLLFIHLCIGEVTLRTKDIHGLPAYAGKYLGKAGKHFMFIITLLGMNGAMIVYLIGGGEALSSLTGLHPLLASTMFFGIIAAIIYFGLEAAARSESAAIPFELGIIALLFLMAIPSIKFANLSTFDLSKFFIPYGVVFFACMGTGSIPAVREELGKEAHMLKKAIALGTLIPVFTYFIFSLTIVGAQGSATSEIGSLGIASIVGQNFAFIGALLALITLSTSFLATGIALKEMFIYDYKLDALSAWAVTCLVPFSIFLCLKAIGAASFTEVMNYTGVISGVLVGIMIIYMNLRSKTLGERKPEYQMFINKPIALMLSALLVLGGYLMVIY